MLMRRFHVTAQLRHTVPGFLDFAFVYSFAAPVAWTDEAPQHFLVWFLAWTNNVLSVDIVADVRAHANGITRRWMPYTPLALELPSCRSTVGRGGRPAREKLKSRRRHPNVVLASKQEDVKCIYAFCPPKYVILYESPCKPLLLGTRSPIFTMNDSTRLKNVLLCSLFLTKMTPRRQKETKRSLFWEILLIVPGQGFTTATELYAILEDTNYVKHATVPRTWVICSDYK